MKLRPFLRTARGKVTAALLALLGLAALTAAATFSPIFAAQEVRIEGVRRLTDARVRSLSGLEIGANVFHLNAGRVEEALRADPWIAEATVTRELPDSIVVTLVERVPVALTEIDGTSIALAGDGTPLPGASPSGLPRVEGWAGELAPGEQEATAGALAALGPALRRAVASAALDVTGEMSLEMRDGTVVRYGPPTGSVAKAEALRAVLTWADDTGTAITVVDVRVPTTPTVRTLDGDETSI